MSNKRTYSFTSSLGIAIEADWYSATKARKDVTIIYLHGGGLLYGVRDDLPSIYIDMLLEAGYDLLAVDYPLAPETKLQGILTTLQETIEFFMCGAPLCAARTGEYVLFGRSAGAYLAFMMCKLLPRRPLALLCFYGYTEFGVPQFKTPSSYYNKMHKVSSESARAIVGTAPIVYGTLQERFSLYVHARQTGKWVEYLGVDESRTSFLSDDDKKKLPPLFMAAATEDPDVPYGISKKLSRIVPHCKLITLYKSEHDFDRDYNEQDSIQTYRLALEFLEEVVGANN